MKVISATRLEDCFDGSSVYRLGFAQAWSRPAVLALAAAGKLDYFTEFPRPFFRLRGEEGFEIRGVEGETQCRLILPHKNGEEVRARVEAFLMDSNSQTG
jgi:hypothetical protein